VELGVGGLIALLVLIAVSALVLYEVTDATDAENPTVTASVSAENFATETATVTVSDSVSSATLTSTLNTDNAGAWVIEVQLNGENIVVATNDNISAENTVTTRIVQGTNTISIVNENNNENLLWTGSVILSVNTFFGETVENVEDKGATVLDLLTILAIVIVAALIIGVVMRAIGGAAGGAGAPGL